MKRYLHELISLLGTTKRQIPWMLALFTGSSILDLIGLSLIVPYVSLVLDSRALDGVLGKIVVYFGLPKEQPFLLTALGGGLVGVFFLKTVAGVWINHSIIRFSQNQQIRLRSCLMAAYQDLPYTDYLRRNSSEYIHCIQSLTGQFANGVVAPLLRALSDGIVGLVIICFLAKASPMALLLMIAMFGPVLVVYDRLFRKNLRSIGLMANQGSRRVVKGIHEGIEGLKEIRILGKEHYFHKMVVSGATDYAASMVRSQTVSTAPKYLLELVLICFVVALVLVTLKLEHSLQSLAPVLALFGIAALRLLPMINVFSNGISQLRFNRNTVRQLYEDLKQLETANQSRPSSERRRNENDVTNNSHFEDGVQERFTDLDLKNVNFSYPGTSRKALCGISLEIRSGESIGLVGPSGSGKTTLVDVLLGLLVPQNGEILYNGVPLRESLGQWRNQIAYLPQQVFLVDNTLRSNVALGEEESEIDDDRVMTALHQARLSELAEQLPNGVNTVIGERGVRLSGGQRQRVALARAFYHGRSVLVMDEATSALDTETEAEIVAEIQRLKGLKTMVVIAHRLSTVQYCDRIYRLDNGVVVESGPPAKILRLHGDPASSSQH